jgi:phytoene synthase
MARDHALSYCAGEVSRHDPERFLTALFAPDRCRESLLALYAFNLEIAKIREVVSEPMLGEIRLQWWREAIEEIYEGTPRRHAVVEALADAVRSADLPREPFDRLIDARAMDLAEDPPATLDMLERYAADTSSVLQHMVLRVLGVEDGGAEDGASRDAAGKIGVAWALIGLIRAMGFHVRKKRVYLPAELIERHGIVRLDLMELRRSDALCGAVRELSERASALLAEARLRRREIPRAALPALLTAPLSDSHLRRIARAGFDPFAPAIVEPLRFPGLRLAWNSLRGRY